MLYSLAGGTAVEPPDVRMRTRVTARASVPNLVRVRTVEWPQQQAFLDQLDGLKQRHGYRYDSGLAEAAGISHSAISNWRKGKQRPSADLLTKIAEAVGEQPHALIAAAGIMEHLGNVEDTLISLPSEIQQLLGFYNSADETRKAEILARVRFVVEWAEATAEPPEGRTTRRRQAG